MRSYIQTEAFALRASRAMNISSRRWEHAWASNQDSTRLQSSNLTGARAPLARWTKVREGTRVRSFLRYIPFSNKVGAVIADVAVVLQLRHPPKDLDVASDPKEEEGQHAAGPPLILPASFKPRLHRTQDPSAGIVKRLFDIGKLPDMGPVRIVLPPSRRDGGGCGPGCESPRKLMGMIRKARLAAGNASCRFSCRSNPADYDILESRKRKIARAPKR